jgi:hypothetical protein
MVTLDTPAQKREVVFWILCAISGAIILGSIGSLIYNARKDEPSTTVQAVSILMLVCSIIATMGFAMMAMGM